MSPLPFAPSGAKPRPRTLVRRVLMELRWRRKSCAGWRALALCRALPYEMHSLQRLYHQTVQQDADTPIS